MPGNQNSKSTIEWLGGVGSTDRGDRVSLNNVAQALVELGEFLIVKAQNNLDKGGNRASGNTASSMHIKNLQTNATKMSLDIEIASTYKFLNDGVKGVESGAGKFAFKSIYPNKKMAGEIKKWLRKRRIVSKYSPISKTETKNKRINKLVQSADGKLTGLSYAIATNIKKHGIKATHFFSGKNTSAVESTKQEQKKRFAKAFKLDIIENLKN
jgi:hypothetical protein